MLFSCDNSNKDTSKNQMEKQVPLVGGWSDSSITPEVKEAVNFIISTMDKPASLKEIISAKSQVVQGMNYEVIFSLEDNSVWTGKVYRDLKGNFTLSKPIEKKVD
ncbi:hypothetical protein AVL50_09830 [Flammeovirga sp. SJP92]|nr:hypothetical protein AVL50_09830 [Flammeovirga sp. SJP92]